nr:immunoglobulin heavy chain junction region [Mus musculus]
CARHPYGPYAMDYW